MPRVNYDARRQGECDILLDVNVGRWRGDQVVMDSSAPKRLYFNTDVLPERDRFPAFCEGMFRHVIGADIVQLGSAPFSGALDIRCAGAVGIAHIAVTPATITRHTSNLSDGNDAIVVQSWQRGLAGFTQGERENRIGSGEALVIDNARPARLCAETAAHFWALTIPRDRILAAAPGVARCAGTKSINSLGLRLLFGYLEEIAAEDSVDCPTAQLVGDHLIDLVALALGAKGEERAVAEKRGARAARRSAILRTIDSDSRDPGLNAITIAARLGITARYVHLLLEETGQSLTHHLLKRRLETAAALLREPQWYDRKIADIAIEAGFTDLSYFSRAFRRYYGATPSDIREAARRQNSD